MRLTDTLGRATRIVLVLLAVAAGIVAVCLVWLNNTLQPGRHQAAADPASLLMSFEEVSFHAVDGTPLAGWFIGGHKGAPAVLLCHDLGEERSHLLNTAVPLQREGFNLFLLDFRGHGASQGMCTLGPGEKRDILGALDYLATRTDVAARRFGVLGVGLGAHAGLLAARDRKEVTALVLDTPYPDVRSFLATRLSDREFIREWLTPLPLALLELRLRTSTTEESAAAALPRLGDRDLLFVVEKGAPQAATVRALYESSPEGRTGDKNLLELERTRAGNLYAADKAAYDRAVVGFFREYLPFDRKPRAPRRAK